MMKLLQALFLSSLMFWTSLAPSSNAKEAKELASQPSLAQAMFAGGCFWKTQYVFSKVPGVVHTTAGYAGGTITNPTYEQVATGKTGFAETVLVEYDPKKVSYRQLLNVFWSNHDPTTINRQGLDIGTEYRSVVFYVTSEQHNEAIAVKEELEKAHRFFLPIVTNIEPAPKFYKAEEFHQNFFLKHGAICR